MARHNRRGDGTDQRGDRHGIEYHPDWLRRVKVGRSLESGRRSTRTIFRNRSSTPHGNPGDRIRTHIALPGGGPVLELSLTDPSRVVSHIRLTCLLSDGSGEPEEIELTIEGEGGGSAGA